MDRRAVVTGVAAAEGASREERTLTGEERERYRREIHKEMQERTKEERRCGSCSSKTI